MSKIPLMAQPPKPPSNLRPPKIKKPKKEKGLLKGVLIGILITLSFRLIENIIVKFALIFAP